MPIPQTVGIAALALYLLALWLPAVAMQASFLHGWEVAYMCGILSFASSMDAGSRAPLVAGTLANLLFLFGVIFYLGRNFWHWSWPLYPYLCWICAGSVFCGAASLLMAGMSHEQFFTGAYLWLSSLVLLLLGSTERAIHERGGKGSL
jgi:hypothetical protein